MKAGFDFGSKTISYAVLAESAIPVKGNISHNGDISGTVSTIIKTIENKIDTTQIESFGITGKSRLEPKELVDPVIAAVEANRFLKSGCRNIFSIGCQSFYLIRLDGNGCYSEHFVNSDCASGTGGFIDQQAERLGFSTNELAIKAHGFKGEAPSIATRCAVFAKSDIIHAQARGFSKDAVCAGLCEGVARNVLANTLKGRKLEGDILFTGGMSNNPKMVDEISKQLGKPVMVPKENLIFNAIGAAVSGHSDWSTHHASLGGIRRRRAARESLSISLTQYPDFDEDPCHEKNGVEITLYDPLELDDYSAVIGIDVGSTSTKAMVMAPDKTILAGLYSRTQGDPVKAVATLLLSIQDLFSGKTLTIQGVGTTGSGRELIKKVIGADLAVNEITAHAAAALFIDPAVDTIIEIGGQDSKFTLLKNGCVTNAVMNYVCAAGTGSFIEEQAKRLDITLDEISTLALGQKAPHTSDRCTVYMERDLNDFLSEGWSKEAIMAAVLFSVRDNYLAKVVGKSMPGKTIYFQGATARNKALVAAFENELQRPVLVSKYCHLTGALGCCLAVLEKELTSTDFFGINFNYTLTTEICNLCDNRCDLRIYTTGTKKSAWGLKCGRDYDDKSGKKAESLSRLEKQYNKTFSFAKRAPKKTVTIGIPQTLYMMEYSALFQEFFQILGINVIVEKSSKKKLTRGMAMINADFCAPMALSHGLFYALLKKDVDYIFFPTLINEQNYVNRLIREEPFIEKSSDAYFCYYSSYGATIIDHLPGVNFKNKILSPKLKFNNIPDGAAAKRLAGDLTAYLPNPASEIEAAFIQARQNFHNQKALWQKQGKAILSKNPGKMKILLLGRPYTLFDKQINLGIPGKLEAMGFDLINQTMLDLTVNQPKPDHLATMHWYFGQEILIATEAAIKSDTLYPIFLTCFRCSPDAYLITYFKQAMERAKKPYLILQLDDHASDIGYMTRIEAAIDTFVNDSKLKSSRGNHHDKPIKSQTVTGVFSDPTGQPDQMNKSDTLLIPATDPRVNRFQQYVFKAAGYNARIVPLDSSMIHLGYRYTSGGECLPNAAIIGSLINLLKKEDLKDPILYLPAICLSCNFNQYASLIKLAIEKAGLGTLRVANFNGLAAVPGLRARENALLLFATYLSSILTKLMYRFQPYEMTPGDTGTAIRMAETIVKKTILDKKSLVDAAKKIKTLFKTLPLQGKRKPRIGILGDIYAKYNTVLNDSICDYAQSLGGEVLLPSYSELVLHTLHADGVENGVGEKQYNAMTRYEELFETVFKEMLGDNLEPDLDECKALMEAYGINNFIPGETTVSVGRMLYYIKHGMVDAVIHVNPVFCCPGVISSSLFRKIQEEFHIPIIDLFYDGTNRPNQMIVPHIHYLRQQSY